MFIKYMYIFYVCMCVWNYWESDYFTNTFQNAQIENIGKVIWNFEP